MRIIFMGSPQFAVPTLQKLIDSEHEVVACYTQPARAASRGKKYHKTKIAELAERNNLLVFTPEKLSSIAEKEKISALKADLLIVVAYGLLVPQRILESTKYGALNIHPSKLPRWRGAAPIQRSIMSGDSITEICIMQMTSKLDDGDIILSKEINITPEMTSGELHDLCSIGGAELCLDAINKYHDLTPRKQSRDNIVYAKKITKEECKIDWNADGEDIINHIRALNPYPAAYFVYKGERIKILKALYVKCDVESFDVGAVINRNFDIKCHNGVIKPLILQRSGKKVMSIEDFLRGFNIKSI